MHSVLLGPGTCYVQSFMIRASTTGVLTPSMLPTLYGGGMPRSRKHAPCSGRGCTIQMSTCLTSDCCSVRPLCLSAEMLQGTHCNGRTEVAREGSLLPCPLSPQKAKNICFLGDLCLVNRIWKLKVCSCPPALAVDGNDGHVSWFSSENVPK